MTAATPNNCAVINDFVARVNRTPRPSLRLSSLRAGAGRDRRAGALRARAASPDDPRDARVDARAPPRRPAEGHQDVRLDLQEPARPHRRAAARRGRGGPLAVGGARFSRKHANFVENAGGASTAEIVDADGAGRERVLERFGIELEPEVELLGDVRFPW